MTFLGRLPNGDVRLRIQRGAETSLIVEASSDLQRWERVAPVPDSDGEIAFRDPGADRPQRFYRMRKP